MTGWNFELPTSLTESSARFEPPGRRTWIETLPDIVAGAMDAWALQQVAPPYEPGGQCSWVAAVRDPAGRELVLKVGWRHLEAMHEAEALRTWSGNGAVVLHAAKVYDDTSALLLERCVPGVLLKDAVPEPEQDEVVGGLLRRLWVEPPDGHPFRPLQVMCSEWAEAFAAKLAAVPDAVDPGLARSATDLFRNLPSTADRCVILCTDLHAENILAAQREPWLAIDPKPYVGDPTYDALQHLLNCQERLVRDPQGLVERVADLLELGRERLALWLFARAVLDSLEMPWLIDVARRIDRA